MRFTERKTFTYDPNIFGRADTGTAMKIHAEYVRKHSPQPKPLFFEVDRSASEIDPLWHFPLKDRTPFTDRSPLEISAINQFQKPDWKLTKMGIVPQRRDNFWLAALELIQLDYFPTRGDQVFWNGYRYMIINAVPDPSAYWQQTGVWLGITAECQIVPEGDARPLSDVAVKVPAEQGASPPSEYPAPTPPQVPPFRTPRRGTRSIL